MKLSILNIRKDIFHFTEYSHNDETKIKTEAKDNLLPSTTSKFCQGQALWFSEKKTTYKIHTKIFAEKP